MSGVVQQINTEPSQLHVVVVGSGPVAMRFTQALIKHYPSAKISVLGNEPYKPYNRVQLSAFLAGEVSREQLDIELPDIGGDSFEFHHATVTEIQREHKYVVDKLGRQYQYDILVLATGSRAHLPQIEGRDSQGVYCFRNLKDAEHLYARVVSSRHIVVVGGGLLGCEAARALCRYNTSVTLIQQASRLMNRQLDEHAADILRKKLTSFGVNVIVNDGVRKIHVDGKVTGVDTRTGQYIETDTVLFCAGIVPNIELARSAGINVSRGISVSDQMQTSDPAIYAIGECCEHQGETYGIVNPGFEQAAVAASHIAGEAPSYKGSLSVSRLKVVGEQICSMGEIADLQNRPRQYEISYENQSDHVYRKIVIHKGHLIGALAVGDWPEMNRIQEAFLQGRHFSFLHTTLFKFTGRLWFSNQEADVNSWPESTLVCQCNALSRGVLTQAVSQGCADVISLQQKTKAGTVCGSCKPLLQQLCQGTEAENQKETAWLPVLIFSFLAVIVMSLVALVPGLDVSDSVQTQSWFEKIWNDGFNKQVTGFSLLGLTLIGLLMSLRKRLKSERLGQFAYWRLLHVVLGALCAVVLIFHTGFHTGENLNQLLIFNFLAVLLVGATAGMVVSVSHKFSPTKAMRIRKFWSWVHIIVTWPLPALLLTHILTVYYF